jgi:hypothetical protein
VEHPGPSLRFEPTKLVRKLATIAFGAGLAIIFLGGGPARAAGVERITPLGRTPSYDLAAAAAPDSMARKRSSGVAWSPHVAHWRRHVAPSGLVTAVDRQTIRYGVNVGRHHINFRLTKVF